MRQKVERKITNLRLPPDMMKDIRKIAEEEERPLNTQLVRFIREGLARYQAEKQSSSIRRFA